MDGFKATQFKVISFCKIPQMFVQRNSVIIDKDCLGDGAHNHQWVEVGIASYVQAKRSRQLGPDFFVNGGSEK